MELSSPPFEGGRKSVADTELTDARRRDADKPWSQRIERRTAHGCITWPLKNMKVTAAFSSEVEKALESHWPKAAV